ncbi:MAG: hypothetical protein JST75_11350 [Bacteroidetes bacterium]|nr:hypothetical protein [Bacteroidota bacterium]
MERFVTFFIKSILISGVLYGYYQIFLRNRKLSHFNRFFLLAIFPLSIALPFIHLSIFEWKMPASISLYNYPMIGNTNKQSLFIALVLALYISIVCILLFTMLYKIKNVFNLRKKSKKQIIHDFFFIETDDDHAPFSFFNNLFWKESINAESFEGKKIIQHELTHIRQHHSYDRLLCQITCSVFWINPFFWRVQKELSVVHEFLADEKSFGPDDTLHFAKMLLSSYNHGSYLNPELGFNRSDISRRIEMIGLKEKKYSNSRLGFTTLALLFIIISIAVGNSYTTDSQSSAEQLRQTYQHEQKLRAERNSLKLSP